MAPPLFLKGAVFEDRPTDLLAENGLISAVGPSGSLDVPGNAETLDAEGMLLSPAFYDAHGHAAMSLLRGYADDLDLMTWLRDWIWPKENGLGEDDLLLGNRLAVVEMIRSGIVFSNDMYWRSATLLRAADELGVRVEAGRLMMEASPGVLNERCLRESAALDEAAAKYSGNPRLSVAYSPHSVYTVSGPTIEKIVGLAERDGVRIHMHASETAGEVENCKAAHGGLSPIRWLERCGALGPRTVLAHCVHVDEEDVETLRRTRTVVVHNPCSNAKLASGRFPWKTFSEAGCRLALGTDGCASNNSLSFFDEMKFAALCAKLQSGDPAAAPAAEVFRAATSGGAEAFGIRGGEIAVGAVADFLLLDPGLPQMTPVHNLTANLVYSADTSCVDTVVCDGRVLMRHRKIDGESEILADARRWARK